MDCPEVFCVQVVVKSAPAFAVGVFVFTVTRTSSVAEHPLAMLVVVTV